MKFFVFLLLIAAATPSGYASAAACAPGYVASSGGCVPATVPDHAHLNGTGSDWICDFGYERHAHKCGPVVVPRNATMARNSDVWRYNSGYYEKWGVCLPKEETAPVNHEPLDFKALRAEAGRRAGTRGLAGSLDDLDTWLGVLGIFWLLAAGMMLIGRRGTIVVAPSTAPRPQAFRPYRAIVARADAWLTWGERIDGLTGGPIAEGVAVTQCPTCQTCYGAESVVVLRRENGARCLACGSRILRQPKRARFETVMDTRALPAPLQTG